ncbi:Ig-like domain-containing domain [Aquirufa novilacunae]|uniref:Ig-like domain-containing domain n=1 Tax=Aquirufa novilacunae TaxID=3139305 RepID=A0ABW8U5S2_9BACT
MRNYLKFSLLFIFLGLGINLVFLQSCAQMAAPPGGKKDTLAPVVINSIPLNKSKNFKGKKIELTFNEYVTVKGLNQELLITPSIGNYETRIRPTGLTLVLDSALKDNTTYTFNFRNAVEDVAERNKGRNIKLVFSTSNNIDSLKIQGKVKHLLTNKKADNITVGLYPYNDSLRIDKAKPYYFVRTDTSGTYTLENLAAGKYYMAAFDDANNNLLYNSAKESVDFIPEAFIDLQKNETRDFKIALQNQDPLKLMKTTTTAKTVLYEFSRGIKSANLRFSSEEKPLYQIENDRNLRIYVGGLNKADTLRIEAALEDSVGRSIDFKLKAKFRELAKKEKATNVPLGFDIFPKAGSLIVPTDSILIIFPKPVLQWVSKKVHILTENDDDLTFPDEAFSWNKFQNILTIKSAFLPKREKFTLALDKIAFVGPEADSTNEYKQVIKRLDPEETGIIEGGIRKPGHYIYQLLRGEKLEKAYEQKSSGTCSFQNVEPGIYTLRVIVDENENGQWDIGDFKTKKKSEAIYYFENKIKLKANFQLSDLWINTP